MQTDFLETVSCDSLFAIRNLPLNLTGTKSTTFSDSTVSLSADILKFEGPWAILNIY